MARISDLYAKIFGKPKHFRLNHFFLMLGMRGLGLLNFEDAHLSGEDDFFRSVAHEIDRDGFCVLDVGANEGDFAEVALQATQRVKVMSIEPHPGTAARLKNRLAAFGDRLMLENIGAGAQEAQLDLYDYAQGAGTAHASFHREVIETLHRAQANKITVPVRPLDKVLAERGQRPIFIKIDTEGFEYEVLSGLTETLKSPDLKYVLMEFNEMNVYARRFVKDFIELLPDFNLFRILPGGRLMPLQPYSPPFVEIFAYQNLVFVRR